MTRLRKLRVPDHEEERAEREQHRVDDPERHVRRGCQRAAHPLVDVDERVDEHEHLQPVETADR